MTSTDDSCGDLPAGPSRGPARDEAGAPALDPVAAVAAVESVETDAGAAKSAAPAPPPAAPLAASPNSAAAAADGSPSLPTVSPPSGGVNALSAAPDALNTSSGAAPSFPLGPHDLPRTLAPTKQEGDVIDAVHGATRSAHGAIHAMNGATTAMNGANHSDSSTISSASGGNYPANGANCSGSPTHGSGGAANTPGIESNLPTKDVSLQASRLGSSPETRPAKGENLSHAHDTPASAAKTHPESGPSHSPNPVTNVASGVASPAIAGNPGAQRAHPPGNAAHISANEVDLPKGGQSPLLEVSLPVDGQRSSPNAENLPAGGAGSSPNAVTLPVAGARTPPNPVNLSPTTAPTPPNAGNLQQVGAKSSLNLESHSLSGVHTPPNAPALPAQGIPCPPVEPPLPSAPNRASMPQAAPSASPERRPPPAGVSSLDVGPPGSAWAPPSAATPWSQAMQQHLRAPSQAPFVVPPSAAQCVGPSPHSLMLQSVDALADPYHPPIPPLLAQHSPVELRSLSAGHNAGAGARNGGGSTDGVGNSANSRELPGAQNGAHDSGELPGAQNGAHDSGELHGAQNGAQNGTQNDVLNSGVPNSGAPSSGAHSSGAHNNEATNNAGSNNAGSNSEASNPVQIAADPNSQPDAQSSGLPLSGLRISGTQNPGPRKSALDRAKSWALPPIPVSLAPMHPPLSQPGSATSQFFTPHTPLSPQTKAPVHSPLPVLQTPTPGPSHGTPQATPKAGDGVKMEPTPAAEPAPSGAYAHSASPPGHPSPGPVQPASQSAASQSLPAPSPAPEPISRSSGATFEHAAASVAPDAPLQPAGAAPHAAAASQPSHGEAAPSLAMTPHQPQVAQPVQSSQPPVAPSQPALSAQGSQPALPDGQPPAPDQRADQSPLASIYAWALANGAYPLHPLYAQSGLFQQSWFNQGLPLNMLATMHGAQPFLSAISPTGSTSSPMGQPPVATSPVRPVNAASPRAPGMLPMPLPTMNVPGATPGMVPGMLPHMFPQGVFPGAPLYVPGVSPSPLLTPGLGHTPHTPQTPQPPQPPQPQQQTQPAAPPQQQAPVAYPAPGVLSHQASYPSSQDLAQAPGFAWPAPRDQPSAERVATTAGVPAFRGPNPEPKLSDPPKVIPRRSAGLRAGSQDPSMAASSPGEGTKAPTERQSFLHGFRFGAGAPPGAGPTGMLPPGLMPPPGVRPNGEMPPPPPSLTNPTPLLSKLYTPDSPPLDGEPVAKESPKAQPPPQGSTGRKRSTEGSQKPPKLPRSKRYWLDQQAALVSSLERRGFAAIFRETAEYSRFFCSLCGKDFETKLLCIRHAVEHLNFKPFRCTDCDMEFTRCDTLQRHLKGRCLGPETQVMVQYDPPNADPAATNGDLARLQLQRVGNKRHRPRIDKTRAESSMVSRSATNSKGTAQPKPSATPAAATSNAAADNSPNRQASPGIVQQTSSVAANSAPPNAESAPSPASMPHTNNTTPSAGDAKSQHDIREAKDRRSPSNAKRTHDLDLASRSAKKMKKEIEEEDASSSDDDGPSSGQLLTGPKFLRSGLPPVVLPAGQQAAVPK